MTFGDKLLCLYFFAQFGPAKHLSKLKFAFHNIHLRLPHFCGSTAALCGGQEFQLYQAV